MPSREKALEGQQEWGSWGPSVPAEERARPELVTAQESPWQLSTFSKSEGSDRADRGA